MKGMPGLYYANGTGNQPRWVGSVLDVDADTAEVRRLYRQEDAEPLPQPGEKAGRSLGSLSALVRRVVGVADATT
jgi:hypothetical protein